MRISTEPEISKRIIANELKQDKDSEYALQAGIFLKLENIQLPMMDRIHIIDYDPRTGIVKQKEVDDKKRNISSIATLQEYKHDIKKWQK